MFGLTASPAAADEPVKTCGEVIYGGIVSLSPGNVAAIREFDVEQRIANVPIKHMSFAFFEQGECSDPEDEVLLSKTSNTNRLNLTEAFLDLDFEIPPDVLEQARADMKQQLCSPEEFTWIRGYLSERPESGLTVADVCPAAS